MKRLKILMLEDSKLDAELIKKELTKEDFLFDARRVETRDDFIKEIHSFQPDIILSDYSLPQFDGITALSVAYQYTPDTPIIIVTGSLSEETAAECMKSGAWDYVVKERLFRLNSAITNAMTLKEEKEKLSLIEANRKKYEFMINTFSVPLTLIDRYYKYEAINDAFCQMQNMPRNMILGNSVCDIWSKEHCDTIIKNLDKAFTGKTIHAENWIETAAYGRRYMNTEYIPYHTNKEISHVIVSSYDITERKKSEDTVIASLKEKEVLLKEIHHRVKNNLQIISSLLHMQLRFIDDVSSLNLYTESINRVKSMALIHENLYQSENLDDVDFKNYINRLINQLMSTHNISHDRIEVIEDISTLNLNINSSIPLGLILNEILSNSFRYAFPNNRKGTISISCKKTNNLCTLEVSDNGIGINEKVDLKKEKTLGLQLINSLTKQLNGELIKNYTGGTRYVLKFPEKK